MDDKLYDYSRILKEIEYYNFYDIQIGYDNINYIVPSTLKTNMFSVIPLFKINPYSMILDNSNDINNKFFYITITANNHRKSDKISIKKPKLFSEFKLNDVNILPILNEDKYYHQIEIPRGDYNYLLIQREPKTTSFFALSQGSMCYPFKMNYHYLPINRDSISTYLNYYKQDKDSYINIVPNNDYIYKYIDIYMSD